MKINTKIAIIDNEEVTTVSVRELSQALEVSEENYSTWVKRIISYFVKDVDYVPALLEQDWVSKDEGREPIDFWITFDMAKHICLMSKAFIGQKYRHQLNKIEELYLMVNQSK